MSFLFSLLLLGSILISIIKSDISIGPDTSAIKNIHVVFSNHLDVGFTDFAINVINENFDEYFDRAIRTAEEAKRYNLTYSYMTHCYLVSLYLHCPPSMGLNCPNNESKKRFINGVQNGYIWWHAFPFNSQQENYDPYTFEFGLKMCQDLRNELNVTNTNYITLSQRDVPGMTRAVIPYLLKYGIKAVSVGVNSASAPPDVPNVFRWKSVDGNDEILVIYHPGGYGGIKPKDCPLIPGYDTTVATAWRLDNHGGQRIEHVLEIYEQIELEFEHKNNSNININIFNSTFSNYVNEILNNQTLYNSLPVIDSEIGDTWSFGDQSDPYKTSITRIIQRKRSDYLHKYNILNISESFYNFSRLLVKFGEHTFGGHMGFLEPIEGPIINEGSEYYMWSNQQFEQVKNNKRMIELRNTWYEQRNLSYYWPLQALDMTNISTERILYNDIINEIDLITNPISPLEIDSFNWLKITSRINNTFLIGRNNSFKLKFDLKSGSISSLINIETNTDYASSIGSFLYQTFTEKEFNEYIANYSIKPDRVWVYYNYGKVGLDIANNHTNKYLHINGNILNLYRDNSNNNIFCVQYRIGSNDTEYNNLRKYYGSPQILYNVYNFSELGYNNNNNNKLSLQVTWINKQQTRIPESLWIIFETNPDIFCSKLYVDKYNQMMDIQNVVNRGQFHIHGTTGNVSCLYNNNKYFKIESIDSTIAGFKPNKLNQFTPFPTPLGQTNINAGIAFNLYNNIWGTNFVEYYPFDTINNNATYRFNIYL